jgi:hypothetical protein
MTPFRYCYVTAHAVGSAFDTQAEASAQAATDAPNNEFVAIVGWAAGDVAAKWEVCTKAARLCDAANRSVAAGLPPAVAARHAQARAEAEPDRTLN